MKIKENIFKICFAAAILSLSSCETFDLDQTENPSTLNQSFLDPEYSFNYIQITLPDFVNSANSFTQRVTRQMAMTGGNSYNNAFAPVNFDNNWTTGYLMLNAIKAMEPKAIENNQTYILGASKIIRCYVLMTMTDMYGNIPYSEALQGNANLTPRFDNSADVYAGVYNELNAAIAYLQNPNSDTAPLRDLYYGGAEGGGDKTRWITLANTLKLKMLNTARLAGSIGGFNIQTEAANLMAGDLIDTPAEDFEFRYGNERDLPNSRHPLYNDHYEFGGGAYIGNYFMWAVSREKGEPTGGDYPYFDPRTQFYFFRQVASIDKNNEQNIPCGDGNAEPEHYNDAEYYSFYFPKLLGATSIEPAYCITDLGNTGTAFLGRDHGDNSGMADSDSRTLVGLYPAGGATSALSGAFIAAGTLSDGGTKGALGQGIMPIMLSSFTQFIKAELMLTMGVTGDAKATMLDGIQQSIDKVTNFLPEPVQVGRMPQSVVDSKTIVYKNFVGSAYDSATPAGKLEILIKEYYIATWGNGIEPYNNYRRTGYPSNFQPTLEFDSGAFFYTALYPGASVNNNPNSPANVRTRKVFWDLASLNLD